MASLSCIRAVLNVSDIGGSVSLVLSQYHIQQSLKLTYEGNLQISRSKLLVFQILRAWVYIIRCNFVHPVWFHGHAKDEYINLYGHQDKMSQTGWLKQHKCTFSTLWRLEVQVQSVGGRGFFWGLFSCPADGCLFIWSILCICVSFAFPCVFNFFFLKRHQSDWIRACSTHFKLIEF